MNWNKSKTIAKNAKMKIEDQITKLAAEYCDLIAGDHHKDRDCHWKIETVWSYGAPPKYIVKHDGYIHDSIDIPCKTYADALAELRHRIKMAVETERLYKDSETGVAFPGADIPGELREAYEL